MQSSLGNRIPKLHRKRGFQLPIVMIILVAIVLSSTFLLNSVIQSQKQVQANLELLRAELSSQRAIKIAETAIDNNPRLPTPSFSLEPESQDEADFATGKVLVANIEDYNLVSSTDSITGRAMNWWDQGAQWWDTYAYQIDPADPEAGYYIVEFLQDLSVGDEYGQDRDYKGDGIRLLYRITARGRSGKDSAHLKQTSYAKVYPNE